MTTGNFFISESPCQKINCFHVPDCDYRWAASIRIQDRHTAGFAEDELRSRPKLVPIWIS